MRLVTIHCARSYIVVHDIDTPCGKNKQTNMEAAVTANK